MSELPQDDPRPRHWPHSADPPQRYWGNYARYRQRGGMVRLEDDIRGYLGNNPRTGDVGRFYFFSVAFDELMKEGIRGDLVELGVYQGRTATLLATMARRMGTTAYLMDTFEGFNPADLTGVDAKHAMEFADTSLEAVRAHVGDDSVKYVKGYFPSSASQLPDDARYALVHIDCDLYAPIASALAYFYPRLLPGGYLIVHDYFSLAWDGAERAVDEFFADKPEPVIPLTDGGGSVVIRKMRAPGSGGNWMARKRAALFSTAWISAGAGGLGPLLGDGWSDPEDWGIWGIGASHILNLYLDRAPDRDIEIEVEVNAALVGSRTSQAVDVVVANETLARWAFSVSNNQRVRRVRIPSTSIVVVDNKTASIRLDFRPQDVAPVNRLLRSSPDNRELGMALRRLRNATV